MRLRGATALHVGRCSFFVGELSVAAWPGSRMGTTTPRTQREQFAASPLLTLQAQLAVMSVHFDERSGIVPCKTPWGKWYQTMEEVYIDVNVPLGTSAKEIKCNLGSKDIALSVKGKDILKGKLYDSTITDEGTWTLEDKKQVCIVLMKMNREAGNCWSSLLEGQFHADPLVQDEMQKKLTLERFQRENPGFDFSGADISGNYSGGGPDFSNLRK
uniref:nudC domain-containing protein 2 n=1 Tax=Pristiophorus japonicus TaxID=55135 RepID=UPI00398F583F